MSGLRFWRRRDEVPVVELRRSNPVRFGIVLLVVIAVAVYFGFSKHIPFTHGFRLHAVFSSAQNIAPKSPVRIAGVTIGTVSSVQREGNDGLVTMEIAENGLPIRRDAQLKIRPRLFLEGSWYIELQPGSPSSPAVPSGYTVPITQTAVPVQLDQVLDALNSNTRTNLQSLLQNYGEALTHKPTPAEDATQAPEVQGLTAAEALKDAAHYGLGALRGTAIDMQALGGVEAHDISKLISGLGKVSKGFGANEQVLGEWVDHLNTTLGSVASQASSLKSAVAELPGALRSFDRGFAALHRAEAPLTSFADAFTPGVKQTASTITASLPWIAALQSLFTPQELGGLAKSLSEATPQLAGLIGGQEEFFTPLNEFNKCLTKVFYPAGEAKLQDGAATSGAKADEEFFYALTGLAGLSQNFDGNGNYLRALAGGGGHTVISGKTSIVGFPNKGQKLIGKATFAPEGTRPSFPATEPPYEPHEACWKQQVPNVNGPLASGPADGSEG
ncbi:MAG TPA: MlaD family protein [Solirubrobacteraceae bacterium]|jgi:ABC-type transporter Mla subunit MlaD|nr:MlaD family protein [Solirubrobacteraceae bacterium]